MNRCWGIGLGRTGTKSFCEALRILGYEHVEHNPPFECLKCLQGGADNGVLLFYKYLDYKFPGSKFVLMLRPLESWLASMEYAATQFPVTSREDDLSGRNSSPLTSGTTPMFGATSPSDRQTFWNFALSMAKAGPNFARSLGYRFRARRFPISTRVHR